MIKKVSAQFTLKKLLPTVGILCLSLSFGLTLALYGLHQKRFLNVWQLPLWHGGIFLAGGGCCCLLISWLWNHEFKKRIIFLALVVFIGLNLIAYLNVYQLTHFSDSKQFSWGMPRPTNLKRPSDVGLDYITQRIPINSTEWLETWLIPASNSSAKGTVLLFPGHGSSKGKQLLAPANVFHQLHYHALLVDFRGVGGSSGNRTTLGIQEAKDIAFILAQIQSFNLRPPFILYGVSMGSAAILRGIAKEGVKPDGIILELPFSRLMNALRVRLKVRKIPTFPLAEFMVFWGSIQHGFNGFTHNPVTYAKQVNCPTLILQGQQDKWVSLTEVKELLQNLKGRKQLAIFPKAGHQLLVTVDRDYWQARIDQFLQGI